MTGAPVHGDVEPGFEPVADSFARGLEKGELGAAVAAYVDGRKVVDLWGGWADAGRTRPWQHDTLACRAASCVQWCAAHPPPFLRRARRHKPRFSCCRC